jgi:multisubunit Na+/H+ antiporter MnhC subunit
MNKSGQTGGVVTGLVFGVATLIVATIVALVIVSNVGTIDDDIYTTVDGGTVTNETVTTFNDTVGDVLAKFGTKSNVECTGSALVNASNGVAIPTANWSVAKTTCVLTGLNSNVYLGYDVKMTYTWTYRATTDAANNMQGNFTGGIDNISGKIPTVLLIAAIVLILGVLAVLVGVWQKMRSGGSVL